MLKCAHGRIHEGPTGLPPQPGFEGFARPPGSQPIEGAIEADGLERGFRLQFLNEVAMPMEPSFKSTPGPGRERGSQRRCLLRRPHALHDATQGQVAPSQMMGKTGAAIRQGGADM